MPGVHQSVHSDCQHAGACWQPVTQIVNWGKMKYIFFGTLAFIIVYLFSRRFAFGIPAKNNRTIGKFSDFETYFCALAESQNEDAFLIATLHGTEDFFQFKHFQTEGFEINFPLITERQQSLESRVITALQSQNLEFEITKGSDGSRFIDAYRKSDPKKISVVVSSLYENIFLTDQTRMLEFIWFGFALPEPAVN